jgi:porin
MRSFKFLAAAVALGLAVAAAFNQPAQAQDAPASGAIEADLWSRPQLTGNWGGGRDWLAAHGVTIDANGVYANPIAGSLISNDHFLNTGFLYSPVESAVIPTVTPGGGLIFLPTKDILGTLTVVGSTETAGENPFDDYDGTTFSSEWTFKYQLAQLPGGMTIGGLYSINQSRAPLTEDPLILIPDVLAGNSIKTDKDSWAVYWNGFQYLQGDEKRGWGVFGRFGFSDGDPNLIAWSMASGIGGVGLLPSREKDRWGVGVYHLQYTDT